MSFAIVAISPIPEEGRPEGKAGLNALRLRRFTGKALNSSQDLYYPDGCTLQQVREYIEDYREHGLHPDDEPTAA